MISSGQIFRLLKPTLRTVVTDEHDGVQSKVMFTKWCNVDDIGDAYVDDTELAGPGFASVKSEGAEMALGTVRQGFMKRYTPATYALKLNISKEAQEDNKYKEAVPLARMLKRSIWQTADMVATLMLIRAENTGYLGGDQVTLASNAHTMPHGGTFSNTMATPMSPSNQALIAARAAVGTLPGLNGIRSPLMAEKVLFPKEQESVWDILLGSAKSPEPGQFNAINIAYKMNLTPVAIHHWTNTTTNWALTTDAENGLNFFWRVKPEGSTWMENDYTTIKFGIRARFDAGWTNARGLYFVGA
jgi:hypothetical protein